MEKNRVLNFLNTRYPLQANQYRQLLEVKKARINFQVFRFNLSLFSIQFQALQPIQIINFPLIILLTFPETIFLLLPNCECYSIHLDHSVFYLVGN